jgi:hypothetical protein
MFIVHNSYKAQCQQPSFLVGPYREPTGEIQRHYSPVG